MSNSKKSRVPFLFKGTNPGACYRVPEERPFVHSNTLVQMTFIRGVARCSLRKCCDGSRNTERIFVKGDTVDIVWPFAEDPSNDKEDARSVWVMVTKEGKTKRLWQRELNYVLERLNGWERVTEYANVTKTGVLRKKRGLSQDVSCVCVGIGCTQELWIEEGVFASGTVVPIQYCIFPQVPMPCQFHQQELQQQEQELQQEQQPSPQQLLSETDFPYSQSLYDYETWGDYNNGSSILVDTL